MCDNMSNFTQTDKPIKDRVLTIDKFEEVLKIDKYYNEDGIMNVIRPLLVEDERQ